MGRHRTTGCTTRHWPDEPCRACQVARTRRSRERRTRVTIAGAAPQPTAERVLLDAAAAAHRARTAAARAYVAVYRGRGLLLPPAACERCGIGERLTPWSRPTSLVAWHPDPAQPREVAWICTPCRRQVRATREPLTLTWVWPGGLPPRPRGRPPTQVVITINPAWRDDAEAAAARVPASFPGLATETFVATFVAAAASVAEDLYAAGLRAGALWKPLDDPLRDALLREWVHREHARRAADAPEQSVEPAPAWKRRARRDQLPPLFPSLPAFLTEQPRDIDPLVYASRMAQAIEHLAVTESAFDETVTRVTAALEQIPKRTKTQMQERT